MNPRESFIVYHSNLYAHARKNFKEPVHNELSFPKMTNLNIFGESSFEAAKFVVEWEVRKVEPSPGSKEKSNEDNLSFIADW